MKTAAFLDKLFNVRAGEWSRLSLLYAMSLVTVTGCTWGDAIVQGAFLQLVGVKYLPWVFISCAACSIGALFVYSAFADRVSNTRLLIGLLAISGIIVLLGLAGLAAGLVGLAYLLLFLALNVPLLDLYNVHWATYVNGYYDIRAAKRIIPILGTAECMAGIIGGLTMPLMNRLFSPPAIIGAVLASLAVMAVLAAAMPRLLHEPSTVHSGRRATVEVGPIDGERIRFKQLVGGYGANLREGYQQIMGSSFLRWMALSTFSMTFLLILFNYGASAIFQAELKTTVAISDFLGVLSGVANLVVLPVQLFLLNRLIARLGLGNASLVYPLMSLVAVGSLVIAPGLGTAALAYLDRTALRNAFRLPTDNLLYNAVPQRIRARIRAFVGGLLIPIGSILGGLLLLTPLVRTSWFLPGAMLALGLVFAMATWMVRRHYGEALMDLLEQEDYATLALRAPSLNEPSGLAADPASLARLVQKLGESTSPERTIFIAQLITAVGGPAAVPIVGQAARTAAEGRLRAALVEVLVAAEVHTGEAGELYIELLADRDAQVRLAAIRGLELMGVSVERRYQGTAARLLIDPEIEVRLGVLPTLLAVEDPALRAAATAELRALMYAPDPHIRARALGVVGKAQALGFLLELVRALTDSADEVRLAAGLATERLANSEVLAGNRDILLALGLLLLHDPVGRARMSAVTVLDRLNRNSGTGAAVGESLVIGLADPNPEVRERASQALVHIGRRAIPLVHEQLDATDPQLRKMAAVVLARLEPPRYSSVVLGAPLNDILLAISCNLGCRQALGSCSGPAATVLVRTLGERNTVLLEELFYLLSAIRDKAAIETISCSLRSPRPEVRANAAEALESLTTPQMAALIALLLEPEGSAEPPLALARQIWDFSIPTPAAALRRLLSEAGDTCLRTLAAAALVELRESAGPVTETEIAELFGLAKADPDASVRAEVNRTAAGARILEGKEMLDARGLSLVEKLILLQNVPFFWGVRTDEIMALASVCDEERFAQGASIYEPGDPGGNLYVVISGRVDVQQEKRQGSLVRLATIEARSCLGESDFFDNNCRASSAIAVQDTLTLRLQREPLIRLVHRHPELALELISVLGGRLREASNRIAELTRTHSRELHDIYDQFT